MLVNARVGILVLQILDLVSKVPTPSATTEQNGEQAIDDCCPRRQNHHLDDNLVSLKTWPHSSLPTSKSPTGARTRGSAGASLS